MLPVLFGLAAPASAAVTVTRAVELPATQIGRVSTATVSFAAEQDPELMGTAAVDGASFSIARDTCSGREITGECEIDVRFSPLTKGQASGSLRLRGAEGAAVVALRGLAYEAGPQLAAAPAVLTFAPLATGLLSPPQRVTVSAHGDIPTAIRGTAFEGPAPGDFLVTADGCTRVSLVPGSSCELEVRATPTTFGGRFARLRVLTDPPEASVTVGLAASAPPAPGPPPPPRPPPTGEAPPPWSFGIVAVQHGARRVTVRLYSSFPALARVTLTRGRRAVRRSRASIAPGLAKVVMRTRPKRGRYRIRVVARRTLERRSDSIRLRVR